MTANEKANMLQDTIYQLYSKEGRSKSYISKLLGINRSVLTKKIAEWNFPEPKPMQHLNPSTVKMINKHRQQIVSMLDKDASITEIAETLHISRKSLTSIYFKYDPVLTQCHMEWQMRRQQKTQQRIQKLKDKSSFEYDVPDLPNETWKNILGYPGYQASSEGRIRHFSERYNAYHLLTPSANNTNHRLYVSLQNDNQHKNLMVARIIAFTFLPKPKDNQTTVNHKNGDITDNRACNLEWTSQSENNTHAYRTLHRNAVTKKRYHFDYILYQNKYQFKTITAFARFLGKSETQIRRYLDEPQKHDIKLIQVK